MSATAKTAEDGLKKLLGRDSKEAMADLEEANSKLAAQKSRHAKKFGSGAGEEVAEASFNDVDSEAHATEERDDGKVKSTKKTAKEVEKVPAGTAKKADKKAATKKK
jgi:DNA topoisomerase-6 subunit B